MESNRTTLVWNIIETNALVSRTTKNRCINYNSRLSTLDSPIKFIIVFWLRFNDSVKSCPAIARTASSGSGQCRISYFIFFHIYYARPSHHNNALGTQTVDLYAFGDYCDRASVMLKYVFFNVTPTTVVHILWTQVALSGCEIKAHITRMCKLKWDL